MVGGSCTNASMPVTDPQKTVIDIEYELVARPIFHIPITQVADYHWFRRAAFDLLRAPPKNMVHVARPGPDVYPFIVTQGALHWIEDMSLFLNRDFQFFVDTIITFYVPTLSRRLMDTTETGAAVSNTE